MNILVAVPAHNEDESISSVLSGIRHHAPEADILVINDASTDRTELVCRNAGVTVLTLPFNMGYGLALHTGFRYALANGYDLLIHMDADGQHDPECLTALTTEALANTSDIVIGSRYLSEHTYKGSVARRVGSKIFSFCLYLLTGRRILLKSRPVKALRLSAPTYRSYPPLERNVHEIV